MTARSKLKNFAPKILLCAGLALLAIRNANIVTDSMPIIKISPYNTCGFYHTFHKNFRREWKVTTQHPYRRGCQNSTQPPIASIARRLQFACSWVRDYGETP